MVVLPSHIIVSSDWCPAKFPEAPIRIQGKNLANYPGTLMFSEKFGHASFGSWW